MHPALKGALIGLAIAFFLVFAEYYMLKKKAAERKKEHRGNGDLEPSERERVKSVLWFGTLLPPGLAFILWLAS